MYKKVFCIFVVTISSVIFLGCEWINNSEPDSDRPDEVTNIIVQSASLTKVPGNSEEFPLPNCGGSGPLVISLGSQFSVTKNVTIGGAFKTRGGPEVQIPATAKVALEIAIEANYQQQYNLENSRVDRIEMEAAPGTHVIYNIQWENQEFSSVVNFEMDKEILESPYTFMMSVPKVSGSYREPCQGGVPDETLPPTTSVPTTEVAPTTAIPPTTPVPTTEKPPIPSGVVAYYKFDGDASDQSGNSHNAIVQGATYTTGRDDRSSALQFDGVDDSVQLPNESAFDLSTFTVIIWLKFDGPRVEDDWIISKGSLFGNFSIMRNGSSSEFWAGYASYAHATQGGNWSSIASNEPLPIGEFFCLAISIDNRNFKSYINGQLTKTSGNVSPPLHNDDPVYIGAGGYDSVSEYFTGLIDEVQIYRRVLSDSEVKQQCE